MFEFRVLRLATIAGALLLTACANGQIGPPFSYAEDRCLGAHNQCQTNCRSIDEGGAQSACVQRCLSEETRCYGTGDDSASSLAVERGVGAAQSRREKEEGYEAWKRAKAREEAEKNESEK